MNATLPHGLITIGHTPARDHDGSHYSDILFERFNVLHSFWKVHAIRHRVSKDPLDYRCQNLFWRTWGNPRLSKTITTTTLTTLWSLCQQDIDPTSLRKGSRSVLPDSNGSPTKNTAKPGRALTVSTDQQDAPPSVSFSMTDAPSSQRSEDARRLSIRRTSIDESGGLGIVMEGGKKSPRTSRPGLTRVASSSNRTSFAASVNRTKGRPSMNRRKSSQGAQSKASKVARPAVKSPMFPAKEAESLDVPIDTTTTPKFELPSVSSWEDEPAAHRTRLSTSMSQETTSTDLVDPNFRNRFAERIASSSNLASVGRMRKSGSVVRFADEVPSNLERVKTTETEPHASSIRRSSLSYRDSATSIASIAIIDEDELPSPGLVRTKSQLSMMIEETRAKQRRDCLEPEESTEYPSLSSRRKKEPTDDEKVLAMAHAEGVTKAGGRRIRRGFKFSDEDESRYSSPSPEPIF